MRSRSETIRLVEEQAYRLRRRVLEIGLEAGPHGAHFGSAYSMAEAISAVFFGVLRSDPAHPDDPGRDRFILSKGHGAIAYYITLAEAGFLPEGLLHTFETKDSLLPGHPCMHRDMGLEYSTGSLGHGLSLGVGVALHAKRTGRDYQTYVLVGDGECNEGSVWEAAMAARQFGLDNLTVIVDRNRLQSDGLCRKVMDMDDMAAKWRAFGWEATDVDGHDAGALLDSLHERSRPTGKPRAVIAHTVKGKGVSFFENNNDWHHRSITPEQVAAAMAELEQAHGKEGA